MKAGEIPDFMAKTKRLPAQLYSSPGRGAADSRSAHKGAIARGRSARLMLGDVGDRVADGADLLSRIVGDLDAEFFLERHHQLDDVEAVRAQIIDEARRRRNVAGIDTEVIDDERSHAGGDLFLVGHGPCFPL